MSVLAVAIGNGCSAPGQEAGPDAGGQDPDAGEDDPDAAPPQRDVFDLYDEVAAGCDPTKLAELDAALEARRGSWPLWHEGRALFVTDEAAQIAGAFNGWDDAGAATAPLCGSARFTAMLTIASGAWPYKLVVGGGWRLDPGNWAYVFDDFAGNADGRNSVLTTHDAGVGKLVRVPEPLCSDALGNCRTLNAYLPPGYDDPANAERRYPVVFMHDGQNIFDDHDCCFGHTGWEVNVQLDADIAAGLVEETIVVGADHGGAARNDEYGWSTSVGGAQETFMAFQHDVIEPAAATRWRLDDARRYVAGSSLGGLISMRLAVAYPDTYAGAASISGAFWPGQDTSTAFRDVLDDAGKVGVAIYLDHGGGPGGGDGYADSIEIRDRMMALGWTRADSPDCTSGGPGPSELCYFHEPGATHDELAWKARAWRWLRFFVGR